MDGQCRQLVLSDGAYDFAAPTDFSTTGIAYDRSIAAGKKVTVCLPFDIGADEMEANGITAYTLDGVTAEGYIHFVRTTSMRANTPYIIELTTTGTPFASLTGRQVSATPAEMVSTADAVALVGTMQRQVLNSDDAATYYGYSNGRFVKVGSNVGINPFRAYLKTNRELGNAVSALFDASIADGIQSITNNSQSQASIYSIDGRLVSRDGDMTRLSRGIYIQGGKKVTK